MIKLFDKLLGLGGLLDGQKTVIGAILSTIAFAGSYFPNLPISPILDVAGQIGEVLFSLGIVHWRVKDLIKK